MKHIAVIRSLTWYSVPACAFLLVACNAYDPDLMLGSRMGEFAWRPDGSVPTADAGTSAAGSIAPVIDGGGPPVQGTPDGGSLPSGDSGMVDAGADSGPADAGNTPTDAGDAGDAAQTPEDAGDSGGADSGADAAVTDLCPDDPDKTAPGTCGCGTPETCTGLIDALRHRYRFDGTGTAVTDSVGNANGSASSALSGSGSLSLPGGSSADHATLPSGLLGSLSAATVELWLTWHGGSQGQQAIAFGTATPPAPSGTYCSTHSAEYNQGSWYQFCTAKQTVWTTARSTCESAGGSLISIESAAEEQYVESNAAFTESVWIGANDITTEGQWYFANAAGLQGGEHFWSGDENGGAVGGAYQKWDTGEPDDTDSAYDCAYLYWSTHGWATFGCQSNGSFVCEWRGHQGSSTSRGMWFTPADGSNHPSLTYKASGSSVVAAGSTALATGSQVHVVLVLDPASNAISLYVGGALAGSGQSTAPLSELRDADNWLGRSHVSGDPALNADLAELRVYDRALSPAEITVSDAAGPDPAFLEP